MKLYPIGCNILKNIVSHSEILSLYRLKKNSMRIIFFRILHPLGYYFIDILSGGYQILCKSQQFEIWPLGPKFSKCPPI